MAKFAHGDDCSYSSYKCYVKWPFHDLLFLDTASENKHIVGCLATFFETTTVSVLILQNVCNEFKPIMDEDFI